MKKLIVLLLISSSLFAFEGAAVKVLAKYFSKETISIVSKQYGSTGLKALEKLSPKYGKNALGLVEKYGSKYGDDGLRLLTQYGEKAVANRVSFEIVKKFGDKGFYLVKQFPQRSAKYYDKYGDSFVNVSNKVGNSRMMGYLDDAAKYGKDDKVMKFLEKYGEKGNAFLNNHWGKLLTSGFVLLNADDLIGSMENVSKKTVDTAGNMVVKSVEGVANSNVGIFIGIALLLFVLFKYGLDFIFNIIDRFKEKKQEEIDEKNI